MRRNRSQGRDRHHRLALVTAAWVLALGSAVASANATPKVAARDRSACRVPKLTGLSLAKARALAAGSGCKIVVVDAQIPGPQPKQLVARQVPRAGHHGHSITVWLVPLCAQSADPGPPHGEPFVTIGPTELVTGLYLDGGPPVYAPRCRVGVPSPGTITISDPATGATVARVTVARGHLATIPLPPGTYAIDGTFGNASSDGLAMHSLPQHVTIPAGSTVRQDVIASIF